jgi:protein-S-isoprenylcysteine O-methyltransferase Ste14
MERMSRWGVGPSILMTALCYIVVASTVTHHWPEVCLIRAVPNRVFQVVGMLLLAIGVPWLVVSLSALNRKYNRDQLATGGIYGIVRNPIYGAWVVFLIPGLVLLFPSWPLLLTPLVAYIAFRARIRHEEAYLEERFGDAYRTYRSEVPELLPFPRRGKQLGP